jgi:hypothetical protein
MAFNFAYIGYKKGGKRVSGNIIALDSDDAVKKLEESGIIVDRIFIKFSNKKIMYVAEEAEEKVETTRETTTKTAEKKHVDFSRILKNKYLRAALIVLLVIPVIVFVFRDSSLDLDIDYSIAKTKDLSDGLGAVKSFFVVIDGEITNKEIKKLAVYLFNSRRKKNPQLVAAMFVFFYPGQKLIEQRAIAILKYNFAGFASWDESYFPKKEEE